MAGVSSARPLPAAAGAFAVSGHSGNPNIFMLWRAPWPMKDCSENALLSPRLTGASRSHPSPYPDLALRLSAAGGEQRAGLQIFRPSGPALEQSDDSHVLNAPTQRIRRNCPPNSEQLRLA